MTKSMTPAAACCRVSSIGGLLNIALRLIRRACCCQSNEHPERSSIAFAVLLKWRTRASIRPFKFFLWLLINSHLWDLEQL